MAIAAYIAYGVLVFILGAAAGTAFSAMAGRARADFATPGFGCVVFVVFGIPCWFVANYLRTHGSEAVSFTILLVAGILGVANRLTKSSLVKDGESPLGKAIA